MYEENREYLEDVFSIAEPLSRGDQVAYLEEVLANLKNKQKTQGSPLALTDAMWEVEERIADIRHRLSRLAKLKSFGPAHGKRKNVFQRRQQIVVEILLECRENGTYGRRSAWSYKVSNDLFIAVEEFEVLKGDPPGNSAETYFRRRLKGEFPGGGNMEGWFALAEKWAGIKLSDT